MKYLAMIALAAMALSIGACAHKEQSTYTGTTSHTATTGYSK